MSAARAGRWLQTIIENIKAGSELIKDGPEIGSVLSLSTFRETTNLALLVFEPLSKKNGIGTDRGNFPDYCPRSKRAKSFRNCSTHNDHGVVKGNRINPSLFQK